MAELTRTRIKNTKFAQFTKKKNYIKLKLKCLLYSTDDDKYLCVFVTELSSVLFSFSHSSLLFSLLTASSLRQQPPPSKDSPIFRSQFVLVYEVSYFFFFFSLLLFSFLIIFYLIFYFSDLRHGYAISYAISHSFMREKIIFFHCFQSWFS
jgi:hypothetical protein